MDHPRNCWVAKISMSIKCIAKTARTTEYDICRRPGPVLEKVSLKRFLNGGSGGDREPSSGVLCKGSNVIELP